MAVIVVAKKDPFAERMKLKANRAKSLSMANLPMDFSHVRRPLRGLAAKPDTFATLEVFEADGTPVPFINAGARIPQEQIEALMRERRLITDIEGVEAERSARQSAIAETFETGASYENVYPSSSLQGDVSGFRSSLIKREESGSDSNRRGFLSGSAAYSLRYSNFLLSGVQESRQEKYQVMETFGAPYIFFFGERPRLYQYSGILLNSLDFQWRSEFWANYDEVLRGTRLVERQARIVLTYDDLVVEGYALQATASEDAQNPQMVQFTFQLFVTNYLSTANIGDPSFPMPAAVNIDTTYWGMNERNRQLGEQNFRSNADSVRLSNLETAANNATKGIDNGGGFLGSLATAMAVASSYAQQASSAVRGLVDDVSRMLTGRETVIPRGAFPLLDEIQSSPLLLQRLEAGEPVSSLISSDTKRLIEGGLSDPYGTPTYYLQDKDLIVDMTRRFQAMGKRVRIVSALPAFVTPVNPANIGGRISDNADEYIQNHLVSTQANTDNTVDLGEGDQSSRVEMDKMIDNVAREMFESGMILSTTELAALELQRQTRSVGLMQMAVASGSFGLSMLTAIEKQTPPPSAPFIGPPMLADLLGANRRTQTAPEYNPAPPPVAKTQGEVPEQQIKTTQKDPYDDTSFDEVQGGGVKRTPVTKRVLVDTSLSEEEDRRGIRRLEDNAQKIERGSEKLDATSLMAWMDEARRRDKTA